MKNLEEIERALAEAPTATVLLIRGYINSCGDRYDLEVELQDADAYARAVQEDWSRLKAADVADLYGDADTGGDLQLADLLTARDQLTASRAATIARQDSGESLRRGPDYVRVGPSTARHPDNPDALYIQRARSLAEQLPAMKPAKGAVPRAKQQITERLDLPTRRYIHNIKLEVGKFEDLQIYPPSVRL